MKRESEEAKRREAEEAEAAVRSAQERQEKIRQAKIDLAARVQPEPDASHEDVTRILIKVLSHYLKFQNAVTKEFRRQKIDTSDHSGSIIKC